MKISQIAFHVCFLMFCSNAVSVFSNEITLNKKDDGYRGIWYMNQLSHDEYVYKYSGGLGTYCANHNPFAVYCKAVNRTFFCYGGTAKDSNTKLLHMVSYYDHATGTVPKPTILLDKHTSDAHDNPVISVDNKGYIWIFSTSHGTSRPSYIHKSKRPYDVNEFELVKAYQQNATTTTLLTNFSYMQAWNVPNQGFVCFLTLYNNPAARTNCFMTSPDGIKWSPTQRLSAIDEGHYQNSAIGKNKAGTAFNYHPLKKGLNWRTNLYYIETLDLGKSWQTARGETIAVPLTTIDNPALVHDYKAEGLNVYIADIIYDQKDYPIILYITSKGYESGPKNDPRTWMTAHWNGSSWDIRPITTSDNNYDMGSLYVEEDGRWRLIAPTETGPQPYNPGGEMALWISPNEGKTWEKFSQLTRGSTGNHTYARRPVNAHPDFYAIWADGNARKPSESNIYFCTRKGDVFVLPRIMQDDYAKPELVKIPSKVSSQ